ncbi:MAG: hypothetical protein ACREKH_14010 [Candidatus Rokuibacteriota bacterium]
MRPLMLARVVRSLATAALTAAVLGALAAPAQAQFVDYDDFSSGALDPEKWHATSLEGSNTAPTGRALRLVEDGALRIALTSWGGDSSNSGFATTRERLNLRQVGTLGGTDFITGLKTRLTVLDVAVQDCVANPDPGNSTFNSLRARAEIIGWFFNDGSGTATDRTGNILASLKLYRGADGVNRIAGDVTRCADAGCSATTGPVPSAPFSTLWSLGTALDLAIVWDKPNGKFTFTVTNPATLATESKDVVYQGTITDGGAPTVGAFDALAVSNSVKNCSSARKRVAMDALFDNVQVQRQP